MPSTLSITSSQLPSTASPFKKALHANPIILKSCMIALGALGLKIAYDEFQNGNPFKVAGGVLLSNFSYIANYLSPIIIPPTHSYKDRAFQEGVCHGVSLKYEGDLPVLNIPPNTEPKIAGYAHGYLLAPQMKKIMERNIFLFSTLLRNPFPNQIPNLIEQMKRTIPAEYIEEMQGIVDGYNAKRAEWRFLQGNPLTLEDVIFFHLLPDTGNLDIKSGQDWCQRQGIMGCTVIIDGDESSGPHVLRTIDWKPMDVYGTYSYMIRRNGSENVCPTTGQSFPGFIGGLTIMNSAGLTATINANIGTTNYPEKMPAVFYIRKLVESCINLNEASKFCENTSPLGAFTMAIFDSKDAAIVHFYQNSNNTHNVRRWVPGEPLYAVNFRYGENGPTRGDSSNNAERAQAIENYYKDLEENAISTTSQERLEHLRKNEEINNIRTTTTAILKSGDYNTSYNNGFAGDKKLQKIALQPV